MSKDFFNSRAATWDEKVAEKDTSKLEAMASRLDIHPGYNVLDVGTGTGVLIPFLLKKIGNEGSLVCLDYAEEMLKIARDKKFEGNITYLCADIEDNHLESDSYDAVVCYSVFPHFQDKPKALREIYRLLKNGGKLLICHTSSKHTINRIHRSLTEICEHLIPENDIVRRILSEAGFIDITINDGQDDYLVTARKSYPLSNDNHSH